MQSQEAPLEIRLFGCLEVRVNGATLPPLHSRRGLWLLAILALRNGTSIDRLQLAALLWPDSLESTALHNLRQTLTDLRRALGPAATCLHAESKHRICLDISHARIDVASFNASIVEGTQAALERAVALYRGALLEGCEEPWAVVERQARERQFQSALESLAERCLSDGDATAAISWLRVAIAADPYREETHRQLMSLLSENGETAAAMEVYRQLRLRLRSELNQEPDASTVSLFRKLRQKRSERSESGGRHEESRFSQIGAGGIPIQRTRIFGRSEAVSEIRKLIARSPLVTLTGTGGIGKTRLGLATAAELDGDFAHGAAFVALASLTDETAVPHAVLRAIGGRPPESNHSIMDVLADYLAPRQMLIILDNCEHLLAVCAALCDTLLERCPTLCILATSRQLIGVVGESVYRVQGLAIPRSNSRRRGSMQQSLVEPGLSAVELFLDRANLAGALIDPTPDNLAAVIEICTHLEGIPLAIELAAARARSISIHEIAARLGDGYEILSHAPQRRDPRHRTLDAVFVWSWNLLTPPEQRLLAGLSVFAGGCTIKAVESIWGRQSSDDTSPIDLLGSLVDKSLVVFSPADASDDPPNSAACEARYHVLEPVRQLAAVRLRQSGPENVNVWRGSHLACFVALAEEADPHLKGPNQQSWLDRLETEHDNLRAALKWAEGNDAATGTRLCGAVWRFWETRGYLTEGREWCGRSLGCSRSNARAEDRAKVLNGVGALAIRQGDYATARTSWEESLAIFRAIGDRKGVAYLLNNLGNVAHDRGDFDTAGTSFRESFSIQQETGDRWGMANTLGNLGNVASALGDNASARNCYEGSLAISRELGDQRGIAYSLNNLGIVVSAQGDDALARTYHLASLSIFREIGDRRGIANSLNDLGMVTGAQGDHASARTCYEESLSTRREIGDVSGIAESLNSLGNLALFQGDSASARKYYEESLTIQREIGDLSGIARSLDSFAGLMEAQQLAEHAAHLRGAAAALRQEIGAPRPPKEREREEQRTGCSHAGMNDDYAFDTAKAEGRAMSMEQAIELALETGDG